MGCAISGSHGCLSPALQIGGTGRTQGMSQSRQVTCITSSDSDGASSSVPPFATIVGNGRIGGALAEAVLFWEEAIPSMPMAKVQSFSQRETMPLTKLLTTAPKTGERISSFCKRDTETISWRRRASLKNSRVLLLMSVKAKGMPPTDGVTAFNPEGLTYNFGGSYLKFPMREIRSFALTPNHDWIPRILESSFC